MDEEKSRARARGQVFRDEAAMGALERGSYVKVVVALAIVDRSGNIDVNLDNRVSDRLELV